METIKHKIDAIKDVRDYLRAKYGESGELLEAKNLIDSIIARQQTALYETAYQAYYHEFRIATHDYDPSLGVGLLEQANGVFQRAFKAAIDAAVRS